MAKNGKTPTGKDEYSQNEFNEIVYASLQHCHSELKSVEDELE